MREFLFRAKRIDNNQWVEGYYVASMPLNTKKVDRHLIIENTRKGTTFLINPDTLGQFIDMFDVNGKRIFEGDILKVMGYEGVLTAEWWTPHRGFGFGKGTLYCDETESNMIEVVGNIYDNPELMEE